MASTNPTRNNAPFYWLFAVCAVWREETRRTAGEQRGRTPTSPCLDHESESQTFTKAIPILWCLTAGLKTREYMDAFVAPCEVLLACSSNSAHWHLFFFRVLSLSLSLSRRPKHTVTLCSSKNEPSRPQQAPTFLRARATRHIGSSRFRKRTKCGENSGKMAAKSCRPLSFS